MSVCAACGTENDEGRKFCRECGAALARVCASCGTPNPPPDRFCGECGAALIDAPPSQAPAAQGAASAEPVAGTERRLVSVLFLDLVSFTTLSEQRDAEEMRALLDRYYATARAVIERHGGFVEKFIGDAVMALWGAPVTHEDDAERAVRTALELVDEVAALGAATETPLQARAGVLTGEAATTAGAADQGMVTGDMVNTASRLQSAAAPGQVFVGDPTYRAASRAVAFEEIGDLELKGKGEPVRAWRALRVVAERQGQNRMAIEPPFVGRTEELRLLKDLLHTTGRDGKTRVVSVTGIGGIGKSRLAWELLKYIDGLSENVWWHHGRCPAYGDGVTFWALGEMVRMRAEIAETDPPGISRAKLAGAVGEHVSDEEDRRWIEPRLAFLLGLDERPAGGREELFAAWRAFFERVGGTGTVVMVFEDVQWADAGLLDFIESMLEWSKARPMYIVTLSRPELVDRRPNWGAGRRNFAGLHLEPIPDEAMAELVRGMVPDAKDDAVARIIERAEGVPLYAVETIRALADRGVLRPGEDAYELVGDVGRLEVPETLHALVASRLDALGPEDRALVQDAAVLGKTFTIEALAAVSGADPVAVEPRMRELVRREFLLHEADPRSPERGQYGFVQSIIREVAYGMLSRADRRQRHLATAHHFEAASEDELAGVVAAHYVEALRATPEGPEADALAARARDWLGQAAERAISLGSPEQALGFLEQALAITGDGVERAALLKRAAKAAQFLLRLEATESYLKEATEHFRAAGDVEAEVGTMGLLADEYGHNNKVEELGALVREMTERLGDREDPLARAEVANADSFLRYFAGDVVGSLAALDRALGGYEKTRSWERFGPALSARAYLLGNLGRHREAEILTRGTLATATEEGDLQGIAAALSELAVRNDDPRDSLALHLEAVETSRRGGYGGFEVNGLVNAIEIAVENGEWSTAAGIIDELRDRPDLPSDLVGATTLGAALLAAYRGQDEAARREMATLPTDVTASAFTTLQAWYHRICAVVAMMAGNLEGGYAEGIRSIEAEPEGMNTVLSLWNTGSAALWLRDPSRARAALDLAMAPERGWPATTRRIVEAGVAALEGHPNEAAAEFDGALASLLAGNHRFSHAMAVLDAVAVLPAELMPARAVDAARDYLESIGAHAMLERLTANEGVTPSAAAP